MSEELALEGPALEGPASGTCCGGIEILGILNEEFGWPLDGAGPLREIVGGTKIVFL